MPKSRLYNDEERLERKKLTAQKYVNKMKQNEEYVKMVREKALKHYYEKQAQNLNTKYWNYYYKKIQKYKCVSKIFRNILLDN